MGLCRKDRLPIIRCAVRHSLLDLCDSLVSVDTIAGQTNIAKAIVNQGGDYLLAVKGNQSKLAKAVQNAVMIVPKIRH